MESITNVRISEITDETRTVLNGIKDKQLTRFGRVRQYASIRISETVGRSRRDDLERDDKAAQMTRWGEMDWKRTRRMAKEHTN